MFGNNAQLRKILLLLFWVSCDLCTVLFRILHEAWARLKDQLQCTNGWLLSVCMSVTRWLYSIARALHLHCQQLWLVSVWTRMMPVGCWVLSFLVWPTHCVLFLNVCCWFLSDFCVPFTYLQSYCSAGVMYKRLCVFQDWLQAVRIWHTQSVNFVVEYCQMLSMPNCYLLLVFSSVDFVRCL